MSVVRQEARRRWVLVAAGVMVLCLLPVAVAAWPSPRVDADPARLRDLILASHTQPYQGYVDSRGEVRLPELPAFGDVAALLSGATRIRAWYASPTAWRVAVLDRTGERDIFRTADGTFVWDFERNLMTLTVDELPVRLPSAADVLPPDLARRLLGGAGAHDTLTAIGSRRIAGVAAAGLRLAPTDPETTIGRVDVWADPVTGLPVQVEVAGRDSPATIFTSRFLDLDQRPPDSAVLRPTVAESAGLAVTTGADVAAALNGVVATPLPDRLAGRTRSAASVGITGVAAYGGGLSTFVVVVLPGRVGAQALQSARDRGGVPVDFPNGAAYETRTALLSALIVRSDGDRRTRRSFLVVGAVSSELLRRAGAELLAAAEVGR